MVSLGELAERIVRAGGSCRAVGGCWRRGGARAEAAWVQEEHAQVAARGPPAASERWSTPGLRRPRAGPSRPGSEQAASIRRVPGRLPGARGLRHARGQRRAGGGELPGASRTDATLSRGWPACAASPMPARRARVSRARKGRAAGRLLVPVCASLGLPISAGVRLLRAVITAAPSLPSLTMPSQ